MNSDRRRNSILSALALAGLAAYVLACSSSFSPDDSKLACPAFDAQTGDLGVSVLDRKSGKVETVFSFATIKNPLEPKYEARLTRTHWLDNKRLVILWPGDDENEDLLNVMALPLGGSGGALRCWSLKDVQKAHEKLMGPAALAGRQLLVVVASNLVARLDLEQGWLESKLCRGESLRLFPAGSDQHVFYAASPGQQATTIELGKLDARRFAQTPLFSVEEKHFDDETMPCFSPEAKQLALLRYESNSFRLTLHQPGQAGRRVAVQAPIDQLKVGNLCFSAKGDMLYGSFGGCLAGETNFSLGILEIPLDGQPARPTVVIAGLKKCDQEMVRYFELALSHDGKTLAAATTYMCGEDSPLRPTDCALFLVDVSKRPHRISKVSLPTMNPRKPLD
jgi:hypothetical protein